MERALTTGATIDDFVTKIEETFEYDRASRLTEMSDDNFNATEYLYDALDRRTKTTYADGESITWTYDKNSNVKTRTDQNGTVVSNTFDVLDRLGVRSITKAAGVGGSTFEGFTYDALDRMTFAEDDDSQIEFDWDSVGNLIEERQGYQGATPNWRAVRTDFTDAGSLQKITYPSGFQAHHTRDAIYRLTAVQDMGVLNVATFTYQGAGRRAAVTRQNGTVTEYTWDGFRRVATIDHQNALAQSIHKLDYAYDEVHNRRMEQHSFDATWRATLPAAVQTWLGARHSKGDVYSYDAAYRMTETRYGVTNPVAEVATPGSQTYTSREAFTIDGVGNRSQVSTTPWGGSATTVTYASDVVNQYTTVGGTSRTHDDNGSLTDDGNQKYVYDFQNHLIEVKDSATSALIASYEYDALGRRTEKAVVGGVTTRYVYCRQQIVEEFDQPTDTWTARYIYDDGIDWPLAMDRADQADVDGDLNTTEVLRFHYHQQALGSVTEMSGPAGNVVEWAIYSGYGAATIRDQNGVVVGSSAIGNPFLFTGRRFDDESGLYHYRARAYDPEVGRFLQRDPLEYAGGLAATQYVRSSPADYRDPDGREPRDPMQRRAGGGIGGAPNLPAGSPFRGHMKPDGAGGWAPDLRTLPGSRNAHYPPPPAPPAGSPANPPTTPAVAGAGVIAGAGGSPSGAPPTGTQNGLKVAPDGVGGWAPDLKSGGPSTGSSGSAGSSPRTGPQPTTTGAAGTGGAGDGGGDDGTTTGAGDADDDGTSWDPTLWFDSAEEALVAAGAWGGALDRFTQCGGFGGDRVAKGLRQKYGWTEARYYRDANGVKWTVFKQNVGGRTVWSQPHVSSGQ